MSFWYVRQPVIRVANVADNLYLWLRLQCPNNYSCQRWNDGWWQCMPIMTSTLLGRKLRML